MKKKEEKVYRKTLEETTVQHRPTAFVVFGYYDRRRILLPWLLK